MQKIISFSKKHKRFLQCALLCALAFCVFAAVWLTEIRGQGEKSLGWALNDQFHAFMPVETQLTQDFSADRDILALSFVLAADDLENPPEGSLELTISRQGSDEILARSTGDMKYILNGKDNYYTTLGFDVPVELPKIGEYTAYSVSLVPHYTGTGRLAVGYEPGGMPAGIQLTIDGKTVDGTVALKATQMRIGGFLTGFYWLIALISIALLAVGFWLFTSQKVALHHLVFCLVLGLGLLYNMVLPPYSAPDERFHINQSFSFASTVYDPHLFFGRTNMAGALRRPSDRNALVQVDSPTVFTWMTISKELNTRNYDEYGDTMTFPEPQVEANYNLYWASAFGVLIGYCARLGFVPTLFLGRFMNLLLFAVFSMLAVKITPVAKQVFAVISLLPMTLHLAASYSRDCAILAVSFLFIALVLDSVFGNYTRISWPKLIALSVLGGVLLPAKIVYFPFLFLMLLIPSVRLGKKPVLVRLAIAAVCLLFLFTNANATYQLREIIQNVLPSPASALDSAEISADSAFVMPDSDEASTSDSGTQAPDSTVQESVVSDTAPAAEITAEDTPDDSICFSIGYILTHPIETFSLCVRSVIEHGEHYIRTLVGGTLGYFNTGNDLNISWFYVILLYIVLTLAWLCPPDYELGIGHKSILFTIGLASCALVVAGCILWTPIYYTSIYGLQGRYFLPALPLLMLTHTKHFQLETDCGRCLVWFMGILNVCILLNVFLSIVAH